VLSANEYPFGQQEEFDMHAELLRYGGISVVLLNQIEGKTQGLNANGRGIPGGKGGEPP